ncbi:unnamed protein product [marine sediment metagenome]|uniref:Uncharacterized protein n=1 Tax=marine sediment metagenome TaxID=412755 RepID=X1NBV4_9ZZZZ
MKYKTTYPEFNDDFFAEYRMYINWVILDKTLNTVPDTLVR